jgi:uncharacterized protein (TIGR03000 family)
MMRKLLASSALAIALVMLATDVAQAQIYFGGGWGGWRGGYYSPYGGGWYHRGSWGPSVRFGVGYSRPYWYAPYGSSYVVYPYSGYTWYGSPYVTAYASAPMYYTPPIPYAESSRVTVGSPTYRSYYSGPRANANQARLRIQLPDANARLWIEGQAMSQTGLERSFSSPPLELGRHYVYTMRASWIEGGREVSREQTVEVQPGQERLVRFQ